MTSPRRAWIWLLGATILLATGYGLLPVTLWKEPLYDALVTAAVVAIFVGIRIHRPEAANQWNLVLLAMVCVCADEWVWFANDVRGIDPVPSWGEALDLAGRAVLLVALARLSSRHGQLRDRTAVIDAGVIGGTVTAIVWLFVFRTYFYGDVAVIERLMTLAYLVLDISLLVGFVLLVFDARRGGAALRLLATGVGVLVAGDVVWLGLVAHDSYVIGHLLDAVWPVAYALLAAAALHPTMTKLADGDRVARPPGTLRLLILPCGLVAIPLADLVADLLGIELSRIDTTLLGVGGMLVAVVIAVRYFGLMRFVGDVADARGARRTEALVREAVEVIAIVAGDGHVTYASPPIERVLGWTPEDAVGRLITGVARPGEQAAAADHFARAVTSPSDAPYNFRFRARARDGDEVLLDVVCVNRLDDPEINGVIVSARDISERDRLEREVEFNEFHDALTGLANVPLLLDHIGVALLPRVGNCGAVLQMDLDDFKSVNDRFGHDAGDALLVSVGERLRTCVRPGDTVARLGADAFAVLLVGADQFDAESTAARMLELLRLPLLAGSTDLAVAASIGIRVLAA